MSSEPLVTVVVACRNESRHIRVFLESLLSQQTGAITWEAVLADGMSDDGTRDVIAGITSRDPRIRVIDNPGRIVSTGLNAAIRSARGHLILRMDAHTEYASDYIRRCVETMRRTGADNVGGPARTRSEGLWGRAIAAAYHSRFACGGAGFHDTAFEGFVDTVPYGCWRREKLIEIGLFDEHLVRNQDDELNLRLARAGGKIYQSPTIVSWYHPRSSLSALFRQYLQYGFWKVAVIRKHRIPASPRHLVPGAFVSSLVLVAIGTAAAMVFNQPAWATALAALWTAMFALYAGAASAAAFAVSRRDGWELLCLLPIVFCAYHFGYGIGFLAGLWRFGLQRNWRAGTGGAFAELTR
ncbi:MAG TPA: glycosyltransferase family 2 protein [Bryobacteraceae bacterium]|nr:glycosyltransferase family 2 protein [Bryobacteraceae bacterium]